jgi:putative endonuclease
MQFLKRLFKNPIRTARQRVGDIGENAARKHLRKAGYAVLAQNWRKGKYEIDLICSHRGVLVFVEVRTRSAQAKVSGYHSITQHKRQILKQGAFQYMAALNKRPHTYRYDIIEIGLKDGLVQFLRHYKNAEVF